MNGKQAKRIRKSLGFKKDPQNVTVKYWKLKKYYKFFKNYIKNAPTQHRCELIKNAGRILEQHRTNNQ